ncbi:MAG: penicillin-binding transpeptidase domain-containing protein, partial [Akkermansiaceae bacterium]|nr:penicillin-binding transpeptidase domain-containing protein [Akkermansiaceae bacterium]
ETAGLVPDNEWMLRYHKRRIMDGDTANMSIGQGSLEASPLQVAQLMAGIANGGALPKLQLITQIQDSRGRVIKATVPERRTLLGLDPDAVEAVRKGMAEVVTSGTGRSGALSYTKLCGKTGTAQWVKAQNKQLAWFAGFLPDDNPRFAFAVLYEGRPGERLSGGRTAAPMVRAFFEPLKSELKDIIAPPLRATVVDEDNPEVEIPAAVPVEEDEEDAAGEPAEDEPWNDPKYDPQDEPEDGVSRALPVGEDEEVYDEGVEID